MNRSESIAKIAAALVKAQSEMGNAVKDSKNPFFKSKFADLNSVREACMPSLNKHGISVLQPTTVIDGKFYVETTLLHESGEFLSGLYEVVAVKQNDPQALGAAVSYSRRYGLQSFVNIGAEDDDSETAMGRGNSKNIASSSNAPIITSSANNVDKLEEAAVSSTPTASRGSFRKNAAKAPSTPATTEATIPAGDL
jgi:hypothetical protein